MRHLRIILLASALIAALTGCAPTSVDDGRIRVVASINVWGDIAKTIGGDSVEVTNVIDSMTQDPHEFAAGANDLANVSRADVLIVNGGGYDAYMEQLVDGAAANAEVITVAALADTGSENEHYWYDLSTATVVSERLIEVFSTLDPTNAKQFAERGATLTSSLDALSTRLATDAADHPGRTTLMTEPLPWYLLRAAGFTDVTPAGLTLAVESGTEIPIRALRDADTLITTSTVTLLAENQQTDSGQVAELSTTARANGVTVMPFSELLPPGEDYVSWMTGYVTALEALS